MSGIGGGGGAVDAMLGLLQLFDKPEAYRAMLSEYDAATKKHAAAEKRALAAQADNQKAVDAATELKAQAQALRDAAAAREAEINRREVALRDGEQTLAKQKVDIANARSDLDRAIAEHATEHESARRVIMQRSNALTANEQEIAAKMAHAQALETEWIKKLAAMKTLIESDGK